LIERLDIKGRKEGIEVKREEREKDVKYAATMSGNRHTVHEMLRLGGCAFVIELT
jgi:hypothetical protein